MVTPPHAPGDKDIRTASGPAATSPPAGPTSTLAPNDNTGQKTNKDDPDLESHKGDPFASPDEQQSLNLEELKGTSTGEILW